MQSILTCSVNKVYDEFAAVFPANYRASANDEYLNEIWEKVYMNDIESFQTLHEALYPLLFNYGVMISADSAFCDVVLVDTFIHFWTNRKEIAAQNIKTQLIKAVRQRIVANITSHSVTNAQQQLPSISLLRMLNSTAFKAEEIIFLSNVLKLDDEAIVEITSIDGHTDE